jgi:hypothetical protein
VTGQAVPVTQGGQESGRGRPAGSEIGRAAAKIAAVPSTGPVADAVIEVLAAGCAAAAFVVVAYLPDGSELRAAVTRARRAALR